MEIFIDGEPFWCAADVFFLVMAQKSIGFEEVLLVMAQKSSAIDENFIVMAHPCLDVEEIFFVMALQSDGNAPNRFAIGEIFFVIKQKCLDGEVLFFQKFCHPNIDVFPVTINNLKKEDNNG